MKEFWQLLRDSIITQSLLALIVVATVATLVVAGREVPPELWAITTLMLGFFFGAKVQQAQTRATHTK